MSDKQSKQDEEQEKPKVLKLAWKISFKELVTAFLAISIIVYTLLLLWPHLTSSPIDNTSAESIFSLLGGWGGIILGYYFGRLPAEKAATQAQERASQSDEFRKEAEKAKDDTKRDFEELIKDYQTQLNNLKNRLGTLTPDNLEIFNKEIDEKVTSLYEQRESISKR